MKKKIALLSFIVLILSGVALCLLLMPSFPSECPYGHTDLVLKTQKVSFRGKPSSWTMFRLKYINPPEEYMECTKCGWIIWKDGQCYRASRDPLSFIPPIPEFTVFNFPKMSFRYLRVLRHGEIVYDYVGISGLFTKEVDDYMMQHLGKHGFDQFIETTYENELVLQDTHNGYTIRIKYGPKTRKCPRLFSSISIIYPGQDQKSIVD
jgi:hypothetical protein